jgi:hypothetical protein
MSGARIFGQKFPLSNLKMLLKSWGMPPPFGEDIARCISCATCGPCSSPWGYPGDSDRNVLHSRSQGWYFSQSGPQGLTEKMTQTSPQWAPKWGGSHCLCKLCTIYSFSHFLCLYYTCHTFQWTGVSCHPPDSSDIVLILTLKIVRASMGDLSISDGRLSCYKLQLCSYQLLQWTRISVSLF